MKRFTKWLLGILLGAAIVLSVVGPIDRTPLENQSFYQQMMAELDTLQFIPQPASGKLKIGWSKVNITPDHPMPMAGYKLRDNFDSVHDSLYSRILSINNGSITVFIITADLLLFPPALKERLQSKLNQQKSNDFLYFAGTHTHNGVGGWNESRAGQLILGSFDEAWVNHITVKILAKMEAARSSALPATLSFWESSATDYVENRLVGDGGLVDGTLRGIEVVRNDSSKAILVSYSAHPTSISKKSTSLSGDYPAALIDRFENRGYHFGMFIAGMVGSHRWKSPQLDDYDLVNQEADVLAVKSMVSKKTEPLDQLQITASHIPIHHGPSQMRVAMNWKIRDWVFRAMMGQLRGEITFLEMGDILLLGTSCDFSGEIYVAEKLGDYAASKGKHLIISSFNGDYTGYITLDDRYDQVDKEEVQALNWVGPYYGNYYAQMIKKICDK